MKKTEVLNCCKEQGITAELWELLYFKVPKALRTVLVLEWNK